MIFFFSSGFLGTRTTSMAVQPTRFEGKDYFEIHATCDNTVYATAPDFGEYHHNWWTCSPTDIICGLCKACRGKPETQQCDFQKFSALIDAKFKKCCAHFKLYMLKAARIKNFQIKSNRKIVCPLQEAFPQICEIPVRERENIFAHIYRNHLNYLRQQDFYCLSISDVVQVVIFEGEAFLYYKLVEDDNLIVGMARTGLSLKTFMCVVYFWSFSGTSQAVHRESHTFIVPFLHECTSNLIYEKSFLVKSLRELSKSINAERNEIRMRVSVKVAR